MSPQIEAVVREEREAIRDSKQADRLAVGSMIISALALLASGLSTWTGSRSLDFAHRTSLAATRINLFTQFQSQYAGVAARFPNQYLEPDFRPVSGTDAYASLEAYWLFCYSEWYATHVVDPGASRDMWTDYYAPLIGDGLAVPSLHYVLEDIVASGKLSRGDWPTFLREIARIARAGGQPLSAKSERILAGLPRRAA